MSEDPYRWDDRVEAWEEVASSEAFLAIRDRILELAGARPDDRVIDLGAGTGLLALALAPRVRELVAVDISERMLERLDDAAVADGIHNVEIVVADLRRLPLEDESATLVVSNYAFHHLDDSGKELALAEARRILRPGGRLVICDMMFSLSLEARDRRLVVEKVVALVKRGPAGIVPARNGRPTATPTPPGGTAAPLAPGRAAASTATASTLRSAPRPASRSPGRLRRPGATSPTTSHRFSTLSRLAASPP